MIPIDKTALGEFVKSVKAVKLTSTNDDITGVDLPGDGKWMSVETHLRFFHVKGGKKSCSFSDMEDYWVKERFMNLKSESSGENHPSKYWGFEEHSAEKIPDTVKGGIATFATGRNDAWTLFQGGRAKTGSQLETVNLLSLWAHNESSPCWVDWVSLITCAIRVKKALTACSTYGEFLKGLGEVTVDISSPVEINTSGEEVYKEPIRVILKGSEILWVAGYKHFQTAVARKLHVERTKVLNKAKSEAMSKPVPHYEAHIQKMLKEGGRDYAKEFIDEK